MKTPNLKYIALTLNSAFFNTMSNLSNCLKKDIVLSNSELIIEAIPEHFFLSMDGQFDKVSHLSITLNNEF